MGKGRGVRNSLETSLRSRALPRPTPREVRDVRWSGASSFSSANASDMLSRAEPESVPMRLTGESLSLGGGEDCGTSAVGPGDKRGVSAPNPADPTARPLANPSLASTQAHGRAVNEGKQSCQGAARPSGRRLPAERQGPRARPPRAVGQQLRLRAAPSTGTGHCGPERRLNVPTSQDRSPAPVTSGSETEAASCPRFPQASPRCRKSPCRPRHRQLLAAPEKSKRKTTRK